MKEPNVYKRRADSSLRFYKNLEPTLRAKLFDQLVLAEPASIAQCSKIIKAILGPQRPVPKSTAEYWEQLGHPSSQAEDLAYAAKQNLKLRTTKCVSPFSMEFWLARINPSTGQKYTHLEAEFERNSRRPIRAEFWLKRDSPLKKLLQGLQMSSLRTTSLGQNVRRPAQCLR